MEYPTEAPTPAPTTAPVRPAILCPMYAPAAVEPPMIAMLFQVSELCACAGCMATDVNAATNARATKRLLLIMRVATLARTSETLVCDMGPSALRTSNPTTNRLLRPPIEETCEKRAACNSHPVSNLGRK